MIHGVLNALGGSLNRDGHQTSSSIHSFDQKWEKKGDLPFHSCSIHGLTLSDGRLFIVDGSSQQVFISTVKG